MDIRRIGQIKEANGTVTGSRTRLKVVKNKIAPPFTACEFDIMYDEGISRTGSIIDLGIEHKILAKKGAWISFEGNLVGQGREAAKQAIAENDALMKTITDAIMEKVEVTVGAMLAQNSEDDSEYGKVLPKPAMTETIVALATPNSPSALGIIRVSGKRYLNCARNHTRSLPYSEAYTFNQVHFFRAKYPRSNYHGVL